VKRGAVSETECMDQSQVGSSRTASSRTRAPAARVLFVVANDWYFHCHRAALAQRLACAGYDVHVATPPGRFCAAIEAMGLRHHPIGMDRHGRNPFKDCSSIGGLIDLYRRLRPGLVHHVALKPILYGTLAARITGVPAVVNAMPGMGYVFSSRELKSRLIRAVIMTAFRVLVNAPNSRVILQNREDMQKWVGWRVMRADRIAIVRGSGIDTEAFRPRAEPAGPVLAILPARLLAYKGIAEFVEAARLLKRRGIAARFALAGERDPGNPACIGAEQLREWEREGVVELLGWQDDMAGLLARSHIVCLPSHGGEGLPKALLEAAACGKPIVTTDVPGCRDVVRHGDNGLLVPPRQVAPLAEALARLIADRDLRHSLGTSGRERALAEFSLERIAAETIALYDELLERVAGRGSAATGSAHAPVLIAEDMPD
jgi:glycosyltransferase involved in cell wall biosynthesis